MKQTLAALSALAFFSAACTSPPSEPEIPTVSGPDASVVVTVDCGADGVAVVRSEYGTGGPREVLVGRNETTQAAGGLDTFSSNYGTKAGMADAKLSVTTSPTRGTCSTTLTDYNGGEEMAREETAGKVTVEAIVSSTAE